MNYRLILSAGLAMATLGSCQKGFLNVRPTKSLVVPSSLTDFQLLLNNELVFNITPSLGELGSDDYYTTQANLLAAGTQVEKNAYFWAEDPYQGSSISDWNVPYQQVLYANVVLAGLAALPGDSASSASAELLRGDALFDRAFAFYNLAITFCQPYQPDSGNIEPGIPIRLSPDINTPSVRGTLQQSFNQVITDLNSALPLLPVNNPVKNFPSTAAAYGLLARVYLDMQDYQQAENYADSCLNLNGTLMDYNQLDLSATYPFPKYNTEVLFESELVAYALFYSRLTIIDSTLYASYDSNDLRQSAYFVVKAGNLNFKGTYSGVHTRFAGIATDEIYLIRAECEARLGNTSGAMTDLNTLLVNRYVTGTFVPDSAANPTEALSLVIAERRKELVFRGLRWNDLRRWNLDPQLADTLVRNLGGQIYQLLPNDPRYTWPIPLDEIQVSALQQNPR